MFSNMLLFHRGVLFPFAMGKVSVGCLGRKEEGKVSVGCLSGKD